jgi:hypothetical protein
VITRLVAFSALMALVLAAGPSRRPRCSVLGTMHRSGLIDRTPDPSDGREVIGQRAFDHRSGEVTEHLARVLGEAFEASEQALLAAALPLLERLADRR